MVRYFPSQTGLSKFFLMFWSYSNLIHIFPVLFYPWLQRTCTGFFWIYEGIHSFVEVWWVMVNFFYQFYFLWNILYLFLCFCHKQSYWKPMFFRYPPSLHWLLLQKNKIFSFQFWHHWISNIAQPFLPYHTQEKTFLIGETKVRFFLLNIFLCVLLMGLQK